MTTPAENGRRADVPLWTPSAEAIEATNLRRYEGWLEAERGLTFDRYHDLWQWSVDEPEAFWASIWEHFAVSREPFEGPVLADAKMPGATWFPETELNYAAHFFRDRPAEQLAIIERGEDGRRRTFTWGELRDLTGRIRAGLVAAGIGRGDRVAAYLPNVAEAVAALLATASIGAIWSCIAPEMGAASTLDRFQQIEPKILLAVDGYRYNGRDFDRRPMVAELVASLPTLEEVVVIEVVGGGAEDALPGSRSWEDFIAGEPELDFEPLPFDHPLWILYSSGTTGLPKPIVHGHGGILLEHLKKLYLHVDARPGDRIMWFSTTGWMMWNFLVGALLTDAAVLLYDGSPRWPTMDALWDIVAEERLTCFGTSAGFLTACMAEGVEPTAGRDLSALRAVGSTGSPLSPEGFEWVYEKVGSDIWLFSSSGGTDLCTSFLGGVPTLPVYTGELQGRSLGANVAALDPEGRPLTEAVGELAILAPMPSMPIFFWNDPDGERLHDSYFSTYPGIWRHGDWIEITAHDGVIVYGRSDSTINRGGVRMGTSEFYASVLTLPEVADALVVDVVRPDGSSWLPLFVVLAAGAQLDDGLRKAIATRLRTDCSPRHVPDEVFAVAEVPRTRSGKPLEVPVKRILMGADADAVLDREALANPASLEPFLELAKR
jgi:acetoacetyl-CoA synthetase